jgi:hypothetical protein
MLKSIITTLFALSYLVCSTSGQQVLTLEKCRQLAVSQNEDLRIAQLQLDKARQQKAAARTSRLPAFSASGMGVYQDKDFEMELILPTQVPDLASGALVPNFMVHPVTGDIIIGPRWKSFI